MSVRYCYELRDARRTLVRAKNGKFPCNVLLRYRCYGCNLIHAVNDRMTVIGKNFYCDSAALKFLRVIEPQLTNAEFGKRIRPFDGLPRLWRYIARQLRDSGG